MLLADLVRSTTAQTLDSWAAEHIFQPLQMSRTTFRTHPRQLFPGRAYSYYNEELDTGYRVWMAG